MMKTLKNLAKKPVARGVVYAGAAAAAAVAGSEVAGDPITGPAAVAGYACGGWQGAVGGAILGRFVQQVWPRVRPKLITTPPAAAAAASEGAQGYYPVIAGDVVDQPAMSPAEAKRRAEIAKQQAREARSQADVARATARGSVATARGSATVARSSAAAASARAREAGADLRGARRAAKRYEIEGGYPDGARSLPEEDDDLPEGAVSLGKPVETDFDPGKLRFGPSAVTEAPPQAVVFSRGG